MEDSVRSQIMKIQPIVEHEPPHKGVEGEAQASEEVRDKHNTLIGLRCRDNLPWSKKPVLDIGGQVSDLPKLSNILLFIKGLRPAPLYHLSGSFSHLGLQHSKPKLQHPRSSSMSGSNLQGRWMASSVTEEDIKKLREARYLTVEIPHRLPAQGHGPTP